MEKAFWQEILAANCALPAGFTAMDLTPELLGYLGSTDPELRDDIAYSVLASWIGTEGVYMPDQLRSLGSHMQRNLKTGLGETGTDTVFLRAFSALILACVIDADNNFPFLSRPEFDQILEQAVEYLPAEQDVRGYVAQKGWAHAAAHGADLLMILALSPRSLAADLERIFQAIAGRATQPAPAPFLHLEDERLAFAAMAGLQRNLLSNEFLAGWVAGMAGRWNGSTWPEASRQLASTHAYQNTRLFLRSLYFQLFFGARCPSWYPEKVLFARPPEARAALLAELLAGIRTMDRSFFQRNPPAPDRAS